jgi:acetyltransferase-like isoleucine patch superfamily enzyme
MFGPYVLVISSNYRYDKLDVPLVEQGSTSKGVDIGSNVWIGGGSVVLDGASIGDNVIVGAGSVISGQVPANVIIQGSPAKEIFRRR